MTIRRYLGRASIAATLAFSFTGSALAADVSLDTTGPGSNQSVVINNTSEVIVENTNVVEVSSLNIQDASTGNVNADNNTTVGGLESGDATNNNATDTTIAVANSSVSSLPVGGSGQGGSGNAAGASGAAGGSGAGHANVLGAATVGGFGGGEAVLPEVGAAFPVDVSALRAAWQPQTSAPTAALAEGSRMFTAAMLITATLLSLVGALGSAFYARRRQERI